MISDQDRREAYELITEAVNNGASLPKACQCLGLTDRTFRNWRKQITEGKELKDGRQDRSNFKPRNALSEEERKTLIERLTRPDVVDLSYAQAFWTLLDKGEYYGSLSTIYRVMKDAGLNARRDGTRQGVKRHKPTSFEATGPNQVWTWDITYLRDARYKGKFFYAYAIVDVFSRLAVHAKVYDADNTEYARTFLNEAFHKYGIRPRSLVVYSNNGASMKANETKALLEEWGIISSHSRPRVSNDNPYSESFFRSLRYTDRYPRKGFESIEAAQQWLEGYLSRYNEQSYHSGVNWVTPKSRFDGTEEAILKARKQVLEQARERHPDRWISGRVRDCTPSGSQWLNPDKPDAPKTE